MTTARTILVVATVTLGFAAITRAAEPQATGKKTGGKPVVTCDEIVKTFKRNNSVDETADSLMVDQSRVAACLKGAGIKAPPEYDR